MYVYFANNNKWNDNGIIAILSSYLSIQIEFHKSYETVKVIIVLTYRNQRFLMKKKF